MKKPVYQIVVRCPKWLYVAFKTDCEEQKIVPSDQLRAILQWWLALPKGEKDATRPRKQRG